MASITSDVTRPRGVLTEDAEVPTATVSCNQTQFEGLEQIASDTSALITKK